MLSGMESFDAAAAKAQLAIVRRGEAAPWVDYRPMPLWVYPVSGIWVAGSTYGIAASDSSTLGSTLVVVSPWISLAFIVWLRRRNDVPSRWGWHWRGMPPELRRSNWLVFFVLMSGLAIIAVAAYVGGAVTGVATALLLTPPIMYWGERDRARAAATARTRLDGEAA